VTPAAWLAWLWLAAAPHAPSWTGTWTFDLCHEDRRPDHDKDTFCREGKDRIRVERTPAGGYDLVLCPSDPWGERQVRLGQGGRTLSFRSREGLDVRLTLGQDGSHFRGRFMGAAGHNGRVWGRRVGGC
jgi:hypothetical protein